ncbi:MAG: hypothetical protein IPH12_14490 [Saprospirales bacterium]|nr:hypothetical protein [Saprospirales bacterium]
MRTTLIILMLSVFTKTYAQWQILSGVAGEHLYDISFYGGQSILISGHNGVTFSYNNGTDWSYRPFRDGLGIDIAFGIKGAHLTGPKAGVVGGTFYLANSQSFFHAANGFETWTEQNINNGGVWPREINAMAFPDALTGFAVGHNFSILKTTNGGANWTVSTNINPELWAISMLDAQHGIVVGDKVVLTTSNGGGNWAMTNPNWYMRAVSMGSTSVIYAGGDPFFLKSTTGGNTWVELHPPFKAVNGLTAIGTDTVFACTDSGLYFSGSGGLYWEVFPETLGKSITKITRNGNDWWVIGKNGFLMRTQNIPHPRPVAAFTVEFPYSCGSGTAKIMSSGSPSWSYQWFLHDSLVSTTALPWQIPVTGIFEDNLKLVVDNGFAQDTFLQHLYLRAWPKPELQMPTDVYGCPGSYIELTTTGTGFDHAGWQTIPLSMWGGPGIHAQFVSDTDAVIATAAWNQYNCWDTAVIQVHIRHIPEDLWVKTEIPGLDYYVKSLDFVDEKTGFGIEQYNHQLVKTTDGGLSWSILDFKPGDHFDANLDFVSPDTGYISSFSLIRTTDGGLSFQGVTTPSSMRRIFFMNGQTGFAAGIFGLLHKTTNGAQTWKQVAYYQSGEITKIECPTPEVCYAVGNIYNHYFLKSVDGGNTWFDPPNTPFTGGLLDFDAVGPDTLVVLGPGKVYKTTDGGMTWDQPVQLTTGSNFGTINMIDSRTGYASVGLSLFKTDDGGACWDRHKINGDDGSFADKFCFPAPGVGYYGSGFPGGTASNSGSVWRLVTGPYFDIPDKICLGNTVVVDNKSAVNGYQQFQWRLNGNAFSTAERPALAVQDTGTYLLTLVAWKNNDPDTFSTVFTVKPLPPLRSFVNLPDYLCALELNTLALSPADTTTFDWHWKLLPDDSPVFAATSNSAQLYYSGFPSLDSTVIQVYGTNADGCPGDTATAVIPVGEPVSPYIFFPNTIIFGGYDEELCLPDGVDTATLQFHFGYEGNHWAAKTWEVTNPVPGWIWEANDTLLTLHIHGPQPVATWKATLTASNPCFTNNFTISIIVRQSHLLTQVPADQTVGLGSTVTFSLAVDTINNEPPLYYVWYHNGDYYATTPGPALTIPAFPAYLAGSWYVSITTACTINVTTDTFLVSVISGTKTGISGRDGIRLWAFKDAATGEMFGALDGNPQSFMIRLTNIESRLLWQKSFTGSPQGQARFPIPLDQFPPGGYVLQAIFEDNAIVVVRILK